MIIVADGVRFVKPGEFSGDSNEVCPAWLRFQSVTRTLSLPDGRTWLDCRYRYAKPNGVAYELEAAVLVDSVSTQTGACYLRACTCPDYLKKRGAARQQSRARHCKHMRALAAKLGAQAGKPVMGKAVAA